MSNFDKIREDVIVEGANHLAVYLTVVDIKAQVGSSLGAISSIRRLLLELSGSEYLFQKEFESRSINLVASTVTKFAVNYSKWSPATRFHHALNKALALVEGPSSPSLIFDIFVFLFIFSYLFHLRSF